MRLSRPSFALVVVVLATSQSFATAQDDKASCTDYAKGAFGPETITGDENCQVACQTAEGLPVGRYDSEPDVGYARCKCHVIEENGDSSLTRDLCLDGAPSGGATLGFGVVGTAAAILVAALV